LDGQLIVPYIKGTSYIHVGRIPQRAMESLPHERSECCGYGGEVMYRDWTEIIKLNQTLEMKMKRIALLILGILVNTAIASDSGFSKTEKKIKQAMQSELRTEKDIKRDANRLPLETLEFFGFRESMKVIELLPGGGWYTKLLAPTLANNGEFFVAMGTGRVSKNLIGKKGMDFLSIINDNANIRKEKGAKFYSVDQFELGEKDVDMIFTFRNYHNFGFEGRKTMNEAAFKALKSGGIYAVVDHTRRHMQDLDKENGRRIDPVLAIKEIQDAGFVLVDYSTLHARSADALKYEVGHKDVTGKTDRFTIKFKKP
jgi:predicted methyltransferase